MSELLVPVSVGELVDKITILRLKKRLINDAAKVANVTAELTALEEVCARCNIALGEVSVQKLEAINLQLWEIEDAIRDKERARDFGPEFIQLARSVYLINDQRAAMKNQINAAAGSRYREEKSYKEYR